MGRTCTEFSYNIWSLRYAEFVTLFRCHALPQAPRACAILPSLWRTCTLPRRLFSSSSVHTLRVRIHHSSCIHSKREDHPVGRPLPSTSLTQPECTSTHSGPNQYPAYWFQSTSLPFRPFCCACSRLWGFEPHHLLSTQLGGPHSTAWPGFHLHLYDRPVAFPLI